MDTAKKTLILSFGILCGVILTLCVVYSRPSVLSSSPDVANDQTGSTAPVPEHRRVVTTTNESSGIINVVKKTKDAVVSVIVTKDLPVVERYLVNPFGPFSRGFGIPYYRQRGYEKKEVGGGTGFIVSDDGYILTNRHVVLDDEADYTVLLNNEKKLQAKVLARDFYNDIAVIKIEAGDYTVIELGDSDQIEVGQTVIAIGNALGEFRNTVSSGIVSGLSRKIEAGGAGYSEQLTGLVQTDASINPGNSGGPLLDISGKAIGINTAIVSNAQNIGFATPINLARIVYESVKKHGRIVRPWLGIQYIPVTEAFAKGNNISVDYGALVWGDQAGYYQRSYAVIPNSPADKAGIRQGDIILKINGIKVEEANPLANIVGQYMPGDVVSLLILREDKEETLKVELGEMKSQYVGEE
ncbi:MAG: trypsin-like peptidase domain-containing protein [Deltaproteobacteria bacterium]|nr:trypsin-like peptidase domain-containing protein [Deltaproteobacteria bacterium]